MVMQVWVISFALLMASPWISSTCNWCTEVVVYLLHDLASRVTARAIYTVDPHAIHARTLLNVCELVLTVCVFVLFTGHTDRQGCWLSLDTSSTHHFPLLHCLGHLLGKPLIVQQLRIVSLWCKCVERQEGSWSHDYLTDFLIQSIHNGQWTLHT